MGFYMMFGASQLILKKLNRETYLIEMKSSELLSLKENSAVYSIPHRIALKLNK